MSHPFGALTVIFSARCQLTFSREQKKMKQEILIWKHFNQQVMDDLERAKSACSRRDIIKGVLGLEKKDWRDKGIIRLFFGLINKTVF